MDILTTYLQPVVVFAIFFCAPLYHGILAAGQAVGRGWGYVRRAGAGPAFAVSPVT